MPRSLILSIAGLLLGVAGATSAQKDPDLTSPDPVAFQTGAAGERWAPAHDAPRAARLRAPAIDGPGPMHLHWGVDLRRGVGHAAHPFVGLGFAAGHRATLYYEQGLPEHAASPWAPSAPPADARLGLMLRTGSKSSAWREFGTLRMQIDVNTRLSLKPRRGGVMVSYQKRF